MILETVILLILSVLAIASATITITHKQPLKSAMALVFHFFMLAGIYLTLSAQFLAVMQIVVYAGAIMILVLFVIMLLNASDESDARSRQKPFKQAFAITISAALLVFVISYIILANANPTGIIPATSATNGSVQNIGKELFTTFLVPLEIIGILLLGAIIGAVMLAKKNI